MSELKKLPPMTYFERTCQDCRHTQQAKDPSTYKGSKEVWRFIKCRKCGSKALDYGSYRWSNQEQIEYAKEIADYMERMED